MFETDFLAKANRIHRRSQASPLSKVGVGPHYCSWSLCLNVRSTGCSSH